MTEYKNKVIWLHKSKAGEHLYAFGKEGDFHNVKSLLMNVSEVETLLKGDVNAIKISIIENKEMKQDEQNGYPWNGENDS